MSERFRRSQRKPNSVPFDSAFDSRLAPLARRSLRVTTIPLGPALLTGSSDLPGGFGRAVRERLPIWPCSVRGFACHRPYGRRGALLPHLFTLTRLRPRPSGSGFGGQASDWRACRAEARGAKRRERRRAVYFLCHCPSSCPDRELPGALPSGVRTFLGADRACARRATRSSRRLRRNPSILPGSGRVDTTCCQPMLDSRDRASRNARPSQASHRTRPNRHSPA